MAQSTYNPADILNTIYPQRFIEIDSQSNIEDKLTSPMWVLEQKLDGVRAMAIVHDHTVQWVTGRSGRSPLMSTACRKDSATSFLSSIDGDWVFDGEFIGDFYHVFDLPLSETTCPSSPYAERVAAREAFFLKFHEAARDAGVLGIYTATGTDQKRRIYQKCHYGGSEGVMLKRLDSQYRPGDYAPNILKVKWVHTADAVVMERNTTGGTNAKLGMYTAEGKLECCCYCSMIGKPDAQPGDVVEVAYLYSKDGIGLVQPRMMKIRDDKEAIDCLFSQLHITSSVVQK